MLGLGDGYVVFILSSSLLLYMEFSIMKFVVVVFFKAEGIGGGRDAVSIDNSPEKFYVKGSS